MKFLILALGLFGCALVIASMALPPLLKSEIEDEMNAKYPESEFQIESLELNLFTTTMVFNGVSLFIDEKDTATERIHVEKISVDIDPFKLLKKEYEITRLFVRGFKITIVENYKENKPPPDLSKFREMESSYGGKFLEALPPLTIRHTVLENASLTYILKIFKKKGTIRLSNIDGVISALGTRENLAPKYVEGSVTAKFFNSGAVTFHCKADLFSVDNHDEIEIAVRNQKMSELNEYFINADGIEMFGEVEKIESRMKLNHGVITGTLLARYHDFSIHFMPTQETGMLKAAGSNLFGAFKFSDTKPTFQFPAGQAAVNYKRRPGQNLVRFILEANKGAAIKAASK